MYPRFVRFVSTPEVLERVDTIESEMLQIEEAIIIQNNDNLGLSSVSTILDLFCFSVLIGSRSKFSSLYSKRINPPLCL